MTDVNQLAALQAQLAALQQQQPQQPAAPVAGFGGWQQPAPPIAGPVQVTGVLIPVNVQTPAGKVKCHFMLPPEAAASPDALMNAIQSMMNAGLPVDAWQPKDSGSGGWGGSSGGSSSWNRGGYRR